MGERDPAVHGMLVVAVLIHGDAIDREQDIALADAGLGLITVFPESAPQDAETADLVHRLRNETVARFEQRSDAEVLVTGGPAVVVDFSDYTGERMPYFIAAVLADEELTKRMIAKIPMGRMGEPEEIVGPVVFLASDASSLVTGVTLPVDGGYLAQ